MRQKQISFFLQILSIVLIPVVALGFFSGCAPDEPYQDTSFIDRYDYVCFPLNVNYKRGEVLGQALNGNNNKHELYYALEGVDPDVMVYLERGTQSSFWIPLGVSGLFYNPDKFDLLFESFQPSGMMLAIYGHQFLEDENRNNDYSHYVWFVTQEVWDAWKDSFYVSLAEDTEEVSDEYRQKQLDLYQELEKRIFIIDQTVIKNFCYEIFLPQTKGDVKSRTEPSWVDDDGTKWSVYLKLHHYQKTGTSADDYACGNITVMLRQNKKEDWIWKYTSLESLWYDISLGEGVKEYLFSCLQEASECMKDEKSPDSAELFDFWSAYFPEDKLPPVFSFPGLGDLVPAS